MPVFLLMAVLSTQAWRSDYEAGLRAAQGWLSLAGLYWLKPGLNAVPLPARCGGRQLAVTFRDGRASLASGEMVLDQNVEDACGVSLMFIRRGERFGIRMRDPLAETRRDFHGLTWYPEDEKCRVRAGWHAYVPVKKIPITNVLGDTQDEECPGYAQFELGGITYRLEPTVEDGKLFFMFRDGTSADATYGSGRFLKAEMSVDGFVELDFNRAYNPPCAYTAFATCPLPPRQNRMPVRVEAGEKRYGSH